MSSICSTASWRTGGTTASWRSLAERTDSIVVVPTVSSLPLPGGAWLNGTQMQQAVGSLFLGNETALNFSANQAGYHGTLPQNFMMTGTLRRRRPRHARRRRLRRRPRGEHRRQPPSRCGDVRRGRNNASAFAAAIANLKTLNIPDYTVAAPPQAWNVRCHHEQLVSLYPGQFVGVELVNGSHVDSMLGDKPLVDFVSQLVTKFSPGGNTAAVYTLSRAGSTTSTPGRARPTRYTASTGTPAATSPPAARRSSWARPPGSCCRRKRQTNQSIPTSNKLLILWWSCRESKPTHCGSELGNQS